MKLPRIRLAKQGGARYVQITVHGRKHSNLYRLSMRYTHFRARRDQTRDRWEE